MKFDLNFVTSVPVSKKRSEAIRYAVKYILKKFPDLVVLHVEQGE